MCDHCEKQVIENIGVKECDLQYLPCTAMKWLCIVPGCSGWSNARDYGIKPFYWDPSKRSRKNDGGWRGGWFDISSHYYTCSKHWPVHKRLGRVLFTERFLAGQTISEEYMISRVIEKKVTK